MSISRAATSDIKRYCTEPARATPADDSASDDESYVLTTDAHGFTVLADDVTPASVPVAPPVVCAAATQTGAVAVAAVPSPVVAPPTLLGSSTSSLLASSDRLLPAKSPLKRSATSAATASDRSTYSYRNDKGDETVDQLDKLLVAAGYVVSGYDSAAGGSIADMVVSGKTSDEVGKMVQVKHLSAEPKVGEARSEQSSAWQRLRVTLNQLTSRPTPLPDTMLVVLGNKANDVWYVFHMSDTKVSHGLDQYQKFRCTASQVAERVKARLPTAATFDPVTAGILSVTQLVSWNTVRALQAAVNAKEGPDAMLLFPKLQPGADMPYDAYYHGEPAELKTSTYQARAGCAYSFHMVRASGCYGRVTRRPYSVGDGIKHWFFLCLPAAVVYHDTTNKRKSLANVKSLSEIRPHVTRWYQFNEQQVIRNMWITTAETTGVKTLKLSNPYERTREVNRYLSNLRVQSSASTAS